MVRADPCQACVILVPPIVDVCFSSLMLNELCTLVLKVNISFSTLDTKRFNLSHNNESHKIKNLNCQMTDRQ